MPTTTPAKNGFSDDVVTLQRIQCAKEDLSQGLALVFGTFADIISADPENGPAIVERLSRGFGHVFETTNDMDSAAHEQMNAIAKRLGESVPPVPRPRSGGGGK